MLLAIAALVLLILWSNGDPWRATSFSIYGATLILLYTGSALYHSLRVSEKTEGVLYGLDRTGIYLLIAGTYTPLCLLPLRGGWGWTLFGIIWGLAVCGITVDWAMKQRVPHWLQALLFISMGWIFLIALGPILRLLSPAALFWLAIGALIYSIGGAICVKHPNPLPGRFHFHDLWHVMVMAASACHFIFMIHLARA